MELMYVRRVCMSVATQLQTKGILFKRWRDRFLAYIFEDDSFMIYICN